nr:MAG TPA: hypothetical protein [Microviridae sp.]
MFCCALAQRSGRPLRPLRIFLKSEVYMSRRHKLSRKVSKRIFRKGASRTKTLNTRATPMRGGFRI